MRLQQNILVLLVLLVLLLTHSQAIIAQALTAEITNQDGTTSTQELTVESTNKASLSNKCFLNAAQLTAFTGSRIAIEGGGLITKMPNASTSQYIEIDEESGGSTMYGTINDADSSTPRPTGESSTPQEFEKVSKEEGEGSSDDRFADNIIYGQLTDPYGKAIGGEEVMVEWTDSTNKTHKIVTTTLTKGEAERLGDPTLEGYWFINRYRVGAGKPAFQQPVITRLGERAELFTKKNATTPAKEGNTRTAADQQNRERIHVATGESTTFLQAVTALPGALLTLLPKLFAYWPLFLFILLVAVAYHYRTPIAEETRNIMYRKPSESKARKEARKLLEKKVSTVMNVQPRKFRYDASVRQATSVFLHDETGEGVVLDKEGVPAGVLTASDVITKAAVADKPLDAIKVEELMSVAYESVNVNESIAAAIIKAKKHRYVPVLKEGVLVGSLNRAEILDVFDDFFSFHLFTTSHLPRVKDVMHTPLYAHKETLLRELVERFKSEKAAAAFLTNPKKEGEKVQRELLGRVGEHEVLDELYNYQGQLDTMDAGRIMVPERRGVKADDSIFTAAKLLLEKKARVLPVVAQQHILGVVTEKQLFTEIVNFLFTLGGKS